MLTIISNNSFCVIESDFVNSFVLNCWFCFDLYENLRNVQRKLIFLGPLKLCSVKNREKFNLIYNLQFEKFGHLMGIISTFLRKMFA